MIRLWLRSLARTFLSGRPFRMMSRPARRLGACLRVEALEDRTVTSTVSSEPPALLTAPANKAGDLSFDIVDSKAEEPSSAIDKGDAGYHEPGLKKLLVDVQNVDPSLFLFPEVRGTPVEDPALSPSTSSPGSGTA